MNRAIDIRRETSGESDALQLRALQRSDARSAFTIAVHFGAVFSAVYLAAWMGPGWSTVACWLWFGIVGHGFHLVLHECAHKLAFVDARRNERLAHWLVAPLYFADFEAFRRRHWKHHREFGTAGDPKYAYRIDIRGTHLPRLLLAMLTMVGATRKAALQIGSRSEASSDSTRRAAMALAVVQPVFALTIVIAARIGHPDDWWTVLWAAGVAYVGVYLYGVAGLTVLMATLRAIAEHRPTGGDAVLVGEAALRNFSHHAIDRLLFGAYGFADHATHHRYPTVQSYLLPELTRRLVTRDPTLAPVGTHVAVLARLFGR